MLLQLIRSGFSMQMVAGLLSSIFVVFCTLPIHEFAHAVVADRLGDPTARRKGRLTLNPFAHLDLWGCLMIVLVGFGYAKPVPVNMRNFKNPKAGMAIVALAGPLSNLVMAILFLILRWVFGVYGTSDFTLYQRFACRIQSAADPAAGRVADRDGADPERNVL